VQVPARPPLGTVRHNRCAACWPAPCAISLEGVPTEIAKLERLRGLGLPTDVFRDVSLKVVARFRQRAAAEAPNELRAHAPALRATLVAALYWLRQREVTDSLVDLLVQVVHKINVRAEKRLEKELMDDFKRVTGKVSVLFHIAEASVDQPDESVRDVGFSCGRGRTEVARPGARVQVKWAGVPLPGAHLLGRLVCVALPAHGAAPAAGS
jgi:hypothetical protein